MSMFRTLLMQKKGEPGKRLPDGFQEIEYVISDNTIKGYINTGIIPQFDDTVIIKEQRRSNTSSFGADNFVIAFAQPHDWWRIFNRSGVETTRKITYSWVTYTYENGIFSEDLYGTSMERGTTPCYTPFFLFRRQSNAAVSACYIAYFCIKGKIELIPAIRLSDNKVGFYDLVNRTFVPPTSGTFNAGPIV